MDGRINGAQAMTQFETIKLAFDERGIMRMILNRPGRRNALDAVMIRELTEAARLIAADPVVRVVILAGEGSNFCAGADLEWMQQQFAASPEERMREATTLAEMFRSIDELPKFVIGVVVGPAFGGGVGLAAVCDVVIAGSDAKFALSETRLGLIPATIAPYLHRRIGAAAMRRLALHGEAFSAAQAMSIGLVSYAVDEGDIEAMTERQIAQALVCAPGAVADAKSLFRKIASGSAGEAEMVDALVRRWSAEEARTGIAAFFKREKAPWQR